MSAGRPSDHYLAASSTDRRAQLHSLQDRLPSLKDDSGKKRVRTLLRPEQTMVLNKILEQTCFPSTSVREAAARELGISPRKVQVWFQNVRQKHKRLGASALTGSGRRYHSASGGEEQQQHQHQQEEEQEQFQSRSHIVAATRPPQGVNPRPGPVLLSLPHTQAMATQGAVATRDPHRPLPHSACHGNQLRTFGSPDHLRFDRNIEGQTQQQRPPPPRPGPPQHRPDDTYRQQDRAYQWVPNALPTHQCLSQALQDKLAIDSSGPILRGYQSCKEDGTRGRFTDEVRRSVRNPTVLREPLHSHRGEAQSLKLPWHAGPASDPQPYRRQSGGVITPNHSQPCGGDVRSQHEVPGGASCVNDRIAQQMSVPASTVSGPLGKDWSSYEFPTSQSGGDWSKGPAISHDKASANDDRLQLSSLAAKPAGVEYISHSRPAQRLLGTRRAGLTSFPPFAFPPETKRRAAESLMSFSNPWPSSDIHLRGYPSRSSQRIINRPTSRPGVMKSHSLSGVLPEQHPGGSLSNNKGPMWTQHLSYMHADAFARRRSDGSGDSLPLSHSITIRSRPSTSHSARTSLTSFYPSPLSSQSTRTSSITTSLTRQQEQDPGGWPSHYRGESSCSVRSSSTQAGTGTGTVESSCGSLASPTGEAESPGSGQMGGGAYSKAHEGYFMHRPLAERLRTESFHSSSSARGAAAQYESSAAHDAAAVPPSYDGGQGTSLGTTLPVLRSTERPRTQSQTSIKFLRGQCGATTAFGESLEILRVDAPSRASQEDEGAMEVLDDSDTDNERNEEKQCEEGEVNGRTGTELCRHQLWGQESDRQGQGQDDFDDLQGAESSHHAMTEAGVTLPPIQSILASSGYGSWTAALAWDNNEAREDRERNARSKGRTRLPGIAELAGASSLWSVRPGTAGRER